MYNNNENQDNNNSNNNDDMQSEVLAQMRFSVQLDRVKLNYIIDSKIMTQKNEKVSEIGIRQDT